MKRWFWTGRRLSWRFVAMVAFVTVSAIGFDFAWRTLVLPFEALTIYAVLIDITLAILLIGLYSIMKRTSRSRSR